MAGEKVGVDSGNPAWIVMCEYMHKLPCGVLVESSTYLSLQLLVARTANPVLHLVLQGESE